MERSAEGVMSELPCLSPEFRKGPREVLVGGTLFPKGEALLSPAHPHLSDWTERDRGC